MSDYTKGPWEVASKAGFPVVVSDKTEICSPHFSKGLRFLKLHAEYRKELMANAHLLAAAPELLEALEMVRDADEDCKEDGLQTIPTSARSKIDAAIAKAEGK